MSKVLWIDNEGEHGQVEERDIEELLPQVNAGDLSLFRYDVDNGIFQEAYVDEDSDDAEEGAEPQFILTWSHA